MINDRLLPLFFSMITINTLWTSAPVKKCERENICREKTGFKGAKIHRFFSPDYFDEGVNKIVENDYWKCSYLHKIISFYCKIENYLWFYQIDTFIDQVVPSFFMLWSVGTFTDSMVYQKKDSIWYNVITRVRLINLSWTHQYVTSYVYIGGSDGIGFIDWFFLSCLNPLLHHYLV